MKGYVGIVQTDRTFSLKMSLPAKKGNEVGKRNDVLDHVQSSGNKQLCHDHHR